MRDSSTYFKFCSVAKCFVSPIMFMLANILLLTVFISQAFAQIPKVVLNQESLKKTFKWNYGGYAFTDQLTFNFSDYQYYHGLSKKQAKENYTAEHSTHPYLLQVAKALDKDAKELGYTGFTLAEYIVAFVQQAIPYKSDPYNYGWDYPKYPIETLVEQGGDCEDKAALTVALLKTFGFDAVLVSLPGHMAAAIYCSNCNGYYTYNGKRYAFIETTEKGWRIGQVPQDSKYVGATILETASLTKYKREDVYAWNGNNTVEPTPYNWGNKAKPNNNGNNWNVNTVGKSSTSTVTINGTTYQIKASGSTTITVNDVTVTIIVTDK